MLILICVCAVWGLVFPALAAREMQGRLKKIRAEIYVATREEVVQPATQDEERGRQTLEIIHRQHMAQYEILKAQNAAARELSFMDIAPKRLTGTTRKGFQHTLPTGGQHGFKFETFNTAANFASGYEGQAARSEAAEGVCSALAVAGV